MRVLADDHDPLDKRVDTLRELKDTSLASKAELEAYLMLCAHDLRSPLATVEGYSQLLLGVIDSQSARQAGPIIDGILRGLSRMRTLADGLLNWTRTGGDSVSLSNFSVANVVETATFGLAVELETTRTRLAIDSLPVVNANFEHLVEVIQNLLENAIRHGHHPEQPSVITISAREGLDPNHVTVVVADEGPGILPDAQERIFQLFERAEATTTSASSSGIGLAICKRLVARNGGSIWVESEFGKGSRFCFTLLKAQPITLPPPSSNSS